MAEKKEKQYVRSNTQLMTEWNWDKNIGLDPSVITCGSKKKVWWLCSTCGHSWEATVKNRSSGRNCPECAKAKRVTAFNQTRISNNGSLHTENPELANEWHPTKNGALTPADVTSASSKIVWWLGKCGHEWDAAVGNRSINKTDCPYCSGRKVLVGFNDLPTTHPMLAKEWHPTKNGDLQPQQVTGACKKNIWWLGECGHEWDAYIYNRKKGHGCPYCSGHKVLTGYNDCATTHPDLAKQWHPTKNGKLTPQNTAAGTQKKIWWICENGHEWLAVGSSRVQDHNCPYCSNQKILTGYNDLATTHPKLAEEWHPTKNGKLTPHNTGAGSPKRVWWQCKKGHEWNVKVVSRTVFKTGCPQCSSEMRTSFQEQAIYHYMKLVTEAENRNLEFGKEIDVYLPLYKAGIEHNGDYFHSDRERDKIKLAYLKEKEIRLIPVYATDHISAHGDVIEYEYNGYNYDSLDWAISKVFELLDIDAPDINIERDEAKIRSGYIEMVKENSLAVHHPELSREWHPTKNEKLTPLYVSRRSNQKVWWLGKCGHEWKAVISSRVNGNGCPYCSNRKVLEGFNDLATTHPKLAKEWHPAKNGELSPKSISYGSGKAVWWICESGHEWQVSPNRRTSKDSGCPICARSKK